MFGYFESPTNQIDKAREAMGYFHNRSLKYPGYNMQFNQLIDYVGKKSPDIFLEGLGFAIDSASISDSKVRSAMEKLADRNQGRIPDWNGYFNALSQEASEMSVGDWVSASPAIAVGVGGDVLKGAAAVGDAVIDTGKSLLTIGPLLIVGAVVAFVILKTKSAAS